VGLKVGDQVYVYSVGGVVCMKPFDEGGFRPEVIPVRTAARDESEVGSGK